MPDFGVLNWTILITYILGTLGLGVVLSKKVDTADDFYLGRRTTPWWVIGISVMATYVSALSFLGAPAWSYTDGLSVMAIHLNYPLVVFLVITFFLPFFYNSGVASIYDYQEKRFGPYARSVMSVVFLLQSLFTAGAILYATSLVLSFITGIDVVTAIVVTAIIALAYTTLGGITAVIWTDMMQAAILFIAAAIIFGALMSEMSAPLADTLAQLKGTGRLNPVVPSLDITETTTIWSGVFAMTLYHITVYGANQMMVQRTLASKNIGDAKKAYLLMGFAAFFIYLLFIVMGVLFYQFYDGRPFENGNTIILQFAADYGVPGLMGLIAASVLAAAMSSLDSSFNSMATVSVVDFYQRFFQPNASGRHYLNVSRLFTLFWAVSIIVPAILYSTTQGSILEILSKVGSYFVGAKLSMFALGFFSKHTTERGLLVGVAVGFAALIYVATQTDVAWPWYCAIGAAVNMPVALAASILLDGFQKEEPVYTIRGQRTWFKKNDIPEASSSGWYRMPGRIDRPSYLLLIFFALTFAFLLIIQWSV